MIKDEEIKRKIIELKKQMIKLQEKLLNQKRKKSIEGRKMKKEDIDWKWIEEYSFKEDKETAHFDKELGRAVLFLKEKLGY